MADEFEISENPDNTPGAVSSGYQRQNTNSEVSRNGLDLSSIEVGPLDNQITIKISGGVDVNGVMYICKTSVILTMSSSGYFYIKLTAGSSGDYLTPVLQASSGVFDDSKNANYDSGERILNWKIYSSTTNVLVTKTKSFINSNSFDIVPIGSIISVHPDLKSNFLPDSEYWALCDGLTLMPTEYFNTTNDTYVPDLTDNRFLVGYTSYGIGGSNTKDLSHSHIWTSSYSNPPATLNIASTAGGALGTGTYDASGNITNWTGSVGVGYAAYTSISGSIVQDILPKYFSVLYYMRIK